MAEIGMIKETRPSAKVSICWWHMQCAVQEQLTKTKLSTTPYLKKQAKAAHAAFSQTFVLLDSLTKLNMRGVKSRVKRRKKKLYQIILGQLKPQSSSLHYLNPSYLYQFGFLKN